MIPFTLKKLNKMPNHNHDNDSVQEYLDRLKQDLAVATAALLLAQAQENQKSSELAKKTQWSTLLKQVLDLLKRTNQLGMTYIRTVQRVRRQGEKIGENAELSIEAMEILICQIKKLTDCTEVLKTMIKTLLDRINCTITGKDDGIFATLKALRDAVDEALTGVKDAVTALLNALKAQEELWVSISGDRGLVYQLNGLSEHMLKGQKPDIEDCASCKPKQTPLFPMDDPDCDFYSQTEEQYEKVEKQIAELREELEEATCKRETAQARKDALQKAYDAAKAAKAC
jgi:hypothetical protein